MCQLLGMSCNVPTDLCFSLRGFSARGGGTDVHADGFGIAFFEGRGCRVFLDPQAARSSRVADLVRSVPIRATCAIAHVRRATRGPVALENCHPFQRELWGRPWAFAHNGDLPGLPPPRPGACYRPVGDTDSEAAFCSLLDGLRAAFPLGPPELPDLHRAIEAQARALAAYGPVNFLLSEGRHLFAHASTRLSYVARRAPFGPAHLVDEDLSVDFAALTRPSDRVAVIATAPLTDDEDWTPLPPGRVLVFRDGGPVDPEAGASGDGRPIVR